MTTITSTVEPGAVYAPDSPLDYSEPAVPGTMILDDLVAPRDGWSAVVTKGDVLTIIDVGGNQSADCL
ncbi:MAG: urea amidolyase associated protein UAAP2, partial [Corynebacterium variabile]